MSTHQYNTRLSTGAIKRKLVKESNSDDNFSDLDSECSYDPLDESKRDSSDDDTNYDSDEDENEDEDEDEVAKIANNKVAYYKFLNKLFPSSYADSKIRKIKKTKSGMRTNISDTADTLRKVLSDPNSSNKNINIIINTKDGTNNIYGYESDYERNGPLGNEIFYRYFDSNSNDILEEEEEEEEESDEEEEESGEGEECGEGEEKEKDDNNKFAKTISKDSPKRLARQRKTSNNNYREFAKILSTEDNESEYFKKKLSLIEQSKYIQKLQTISNLTTIETPYLIHLINLDIPDTYKAAALRKINILRSMDGNNSEYYKIKGWVDAFIKIPFNKYNNLPITFADGIDKCHDFMEHAKNTLDSVVYGLDDAKIQIMQLIGLWLVNPNAIGSAIAIKGPPGTGKTTLIKDGISKILNRPFALVALGGCGDSGFLDGHDYTYEGSKYGKIIDILIQTGSMNPVILFDELDKISDSPKGEEIAGVLTHLTDTTQNSHFTDKYMSEISLDTSKALYIFSYNDESRVNAVLKDRMYKIETKGYKVKDKLIICKDYILPKIREQAKFDEADIIFTDDIVEYIINDFTDKEAGVRNLKRCIEIIYTKLNLYRLMKPDINLFESSFKLSEKVVFPIILKRETIDKLLNKSNKDEVPFGMYN